MSLKKFVLIILDGAGDSYRNEEGRSPLGMACTPNMDKIARGGVTGRMKTLFADLPKESLVAHLGMLGWDPYRYYPCGRASAELLASSGMSLNANDIAFRANFVRIEEEKLLSYNGNDISTDEAIPLVQKINLGLKDEFPHFQLFHNSEFRNTLIFRDMGVDPSDLECVEPHENVNSCVQRDHFIRGKHDRSRRAAEQMTGYLGRVMDILKSEHANAIMPWSASGPFRLPSFAEHSGFAGRAGMVGAMSFLNGIGVAGKIDFYKVGTGMPETDFAGKGEKVISMLCEGYDLVLCHINAPDEASHMRSLELKIASIEKIDKYIVGPVHEYFHYNRAQLGGVMVIPDHYTNVFCGQNGKKRIASHGVDPVPFALWNGESRDRVSELTEDAVLAGKYGGTPLPSLCLIDLLTKRKS